jgi:hypothetical protein
MSLTPERQRQIIAKESAWIHDGFGQLDLTAFPALNELPPEQVHDNRFSKDWRDTALSASATALRQFVSDPDAESLERVGGEIGHEGFRDEVRQRKGESVAARFKSVCPDYLPTDANYDMIVDTLAFNALPASQQEGQPRQSLRRNRRSQTRAWTSWSRGWRPLRTACSGSLRCGLTRCHRMCTMRPNGTGPSSASWMDSYERKIQQPLIA